jgi:hypothetical protein
MLGEVRTRPANDAWGCPCGQGSIGRLVQGLSALGRAQPAEMAARYGAEKALLDRRELQAVEA